jgi:hypothetical protein
MFANSFNGEPIECVGGVLNDLVADARGVHVAISGSGLFYADPKGVFSKYGEGISGANGIILSREGVHPSQNATLSVHVRAQGAASSSYL